MPTAICTQRCFHRGVIEKGDKLELTDVELALPHVKASFRIISKNEKEPGEKKETDPLKAPDGLPLHANGQIPTDEIKRKLTDAGVRFKENADRQELFVLLQEVFEPHTGKK